MEKLSTLKQELQAVIDKLSEMELERDEHQLVIDALSAMEGDRKCFRLVGGVLVERNVRQVLPAVIANKDGLGINYKEKEAEIINFEKSK